MIEISEHVIYRYRQRCHPGSKDSRIKKKLYEMWEKGTPAELKKEYRAFQLAKHGADKITEYRIRGDMVLVSVDGTLTTIHNNESQRWRPAAHLKTEKAKERVHRIALKVPNTPFLVSGPSAASIWNELGLAVEEYKKALEEEKK